jgi:hypothetical protein
MPSASYGSIWRRSVTELAKKLTPDEEIQQALAVLAQTPVGAHAESERADITDCIQIGTLFKVEARAPAWHALLRFDIADISAGDYALHIIAQRHQEAGCIQSVTAIEGQDRYMHQYALIANFPIRYEVVTRSTRGTLQLWLVGISDAKQFSPEEAGVRR